MDISFVIPARNEKDTLRYTLANLCQTASEYNFEIIVVDDHSDEDLSKYLNPSDEVLFIRNAERLGIAKSRNIGAQLAKGDVLIFLDAHVCFKRDWIDEIMRNKKLLETSILGTATCLLEDSSAFQAMSVRFQTPCLDAKKVYYGWQHFYLPIPGSAPNHVKKSSRSFSIPLVEAASLVITRELFYDLGSFEDELTGSGNCEDDELCMRTWAFGYRVVVLPSILCFHYKAPLPRHGNGVHSDPGEPFLKELYDDCLENVLRTLYLHLSEKRFQSLLDHYQTHPAFKADLDSIISERLKERKAFITRQRVHDDEWLWERMHRVG